MALSPLERVLEKKYLRPAPQPPSGFPLGGFVFTFHERELPLFEKLKQVVGSGSINQDKNGVCRFNQDKNGCRFIVTNIYTNVFSLFHKLLFIYLIVVILFFTGYAFLSSREAAPVVVYDSGAFLLLRS